MNIVPIQDVAFDDKATLAMGAAFDQACMSLRALAVHRQRVKSSQSEIIEAAKIGERDPAQLYEKALKTFSSGDMPMRIVGGDRDFPIPAYALVARTA